MGPEHSDGTAPLDDEADAAGATLQQAAFWRDVYVDIVAMEEKVLARVHELMAHQSPEGQRVVAATNVPAITGHLERFRGRLEFWETRLRELS